MTLMPAPHRSPVDTTMKAASRMTERLIGWPAPLRMGLALAIVGISVALRLALNPVWGTGLPYITLFPAVMVSAWIGGFWPGAVATILSAVAAAYFWIPPVGAVWMTDARELLGVLVFVGLGMFISLLNEAWRRTTSALSESQQRLDVTLGSIGDAVITTDERGRIMRLNAVAERLTGWSAGDAVGRPLADVFVIINEQSRLPVRNPIEQVLRDGTIAGLANHTLLIGKQGREIPIDDSAAPIRAEDGTTSGVVMVFRDISERRRYDLDREAQQARARELAAIVESSEDAILSKDLHSTITSWNRGAARMFGYSAAEAIGQSIRLIIPEARWEEEAEVISRLRRGLTIDHFETVRRRRDGSELPVSLSISPVYSAAGVVTGASTIARDISDRVALERERTQMLAREQAARAEVERASRLKDDFLAMLSHELRTPLNAVLGYAQLLRAGSLSGDAMTHALDAIHRNAHAQSRLLDSLLDLTRVVAGKFELEVAEMDVCEVLRDAVDVVRPDAAAKSIEIEVEGCDQAMPLAGDGGRLLQVFWNVLANAVKFTPAHGRIGVAAVRTGDTVRVEVTDNGQGISPEFLPHIFDRFKQQPRRDRSAASGLGLGLSLVREIVQAHGGQVSASSAGEGHGATFVIALPLPQHAAAVHRAPAAAAGTAMAVRILVVDDDADGLDLMSLLLTSRGAVVRTASSVPRALEALRQGAIDLLLADIGMPGQDGYDLIRLVRGLEQEQGRQRLPAVALTAYASQSHRDRAIEAGFDAHLPKPVDPEILLQTVIRLTSGAAI